MLYDRKRDRFDNPGVGPSGRSPMQKLIVYRPSQLSDTLVLRISGTNNAIYQLVVLSEGNAGRPDGGNGGI
ncbi:MAG: hypothetical protein AB4352_06205 [Hormoscilla sp.]